MNVNKILKIYFPFTLNEIKARMSYRISFYFFIIGSILGILVQYFLWKAIFQSSNKDIINGFTFNNMSTYIIISYLVSLLVNSIRTNEIYYDVTDGSIASNLIKPINYKTKILFTSIGSFSINFITLALPIWLVVNISNFIISGTLSFNIYNLLISMLSTILSFLINFLFSFSFSLLSFYTTYMWGLNMSKTAIIRFFSGEIIPIAFFPITVQSIMSFFPFASMNYTPVMIYLGKLQGQDLLFALLNQIIWIIILFLFSEFFWNHAIKKLTLLGG